MKYHADVWREDDYFWIKFRMADDERVVFWDFSETELMHTAAYKLIRYVHAKQSTVKWIWPNLAVPSIIQDGFTVTATIEKRK